MDELEISGKRYLSTRRAAKDHKYTSDYVGQLIRGGKVVGKKVGRSWYVDEESLNAYLRGETQAPAIKAKLAAMEEKVVEEKKPEAVVGEKFEEAIVDTSVQEIEEKQKEVEKVVEEKNSKPIIIAANVTEERHIPIHTPKVQKKMSGGLRYVTDDEPALPEITRKAVVHTTTPVPSFAEEAEQEPPVAYTEEVLEKEQVEIIPRRRIGGLAIASILIAGVATLGATALLSTTLNSHIVVEKGQAASVEIGFQ